MAFWKLALLPLPDDFFKKDASIHVMEGRTGS